MRKIVMVSASMFIALILLGACTFNENNDDDIILYTSIYPIQYVTEQLTHNIAEVVSIYPPGVDAHSYEPTTREMLEIARGKAFIYLGAGMEGFAESAQSALQASDVQFIEVGQHRQLFSKENVDHNHPDVDPHIWFDPLRMIEMGEIIQNELIEIFPNDEETLKENFTQLKDKLLILDEQYKTTLHSKLNKQIIVSHAAYGYWEDRYNIKQIPISGLTAGDEPSQKELATIVQLAKDEHIDYILFEQNASNRVATIIQEHLGAKALYIHNLEVLVDEDIENNEDYFSLMRKNLQVLDQATKLR